MKRAPRVLLVALLLVVGFAIDASRPPNNQWSAAAAVGVVHLYQRTASSLLARAGLHCRFTPSCSRYAEAVLRTHGILGGTWRAARRIARCGPWTPTGTIDLPD